MARSLSACRSRHPSASGRHVFILSLLWQTLWGNEQSARGASGARPRVEARTHASAHPREHTHTRRRKQRRRGEHGRAPLGLRRRPASSAARRGPSNEEEASRWAWGGGSSQGRPCRRLGRLVLSEPRRAAAQHPGEAKISEISKTSEISISRRKPAGRIRAKPRRGWPASMVRVLRDLRDLRYLRDLIPRCRAACRAAGLPERSGRNQ